MFTSRAYRSAAKNRRAAVAGRAISLEKIQAPRARADVTLPMRLLSFLSDIERALQAESPAAEGGAWETTRMVNFHHGLARLTVTPRPGTELPCNGGTVFLQSFSLADGSVCLKASLNWKGSTALPVIAVYSTPKLNWKLEASRIASAWLEGPPANITELSSSMNELVPLIAATG